MRTETAAQAKGTKRGACCREIPHEGTRMRRVFDIFMANKGVPVDIAPSQFGGRNKGSVVRQLTDIYGLDLRCIRPGRWVLAGEWFGRHYVDYIAERLAEHDARK